MHGWSTGQGYDSQRGQDVPPALGGPCYPVSGACINGMPVYSSAQYVQSQGRYPQPHPVVSSNAPGINMVNSTGGAGCEPGYNYLFYHDHTKIHVFLCQEPPWRASGKDFPYVRFQVATNTTIEQLMKGFGACNQNPTKNRITEVYQDGSGGWVRGVIFQGDNPQIKKTLKECGWDGTRTGREKPVVWLWVTKD
ncbi:hypothetical protein F4777DRAFT_106903 [Nemania sp. FL0916]|nr:hypothetical protein F4777DRAFT_106903 [Nemania sp. FL0916]